MSDPTDTPAQAAARAWLHSYGINTSRYVDGGGDHPAMRTLPQAFEEFARSVKDLPRPHYEAMLERVLISGNHLGLLIGADHPPYTATHDQALEHYVGENHDHDGYEAWCCWRTIMELRDAVHV